MSDELPYAADIKARLAAANAVDLNKVITQGIGLLHVQRRKRSAVPHFEEFFGMAMAFSVVRQYKELFGVAKRNRAAIVPNRGNINGSNMSRKEVETRVVPQQRLCSIGHVFVTERTWLYGMHDRSLARSL